MEDQPLYPYRDTAGADEQVASQQSPQYPQRQYQYPQQQYPYPGQQPQYPMQQPQYQPQQPQGYPAGGYAGTGYWMPSPPSNTLATVALALGVVGTLFALLGYIMPNLAALVLDCTIALPAVVLGFVGIRTSRRMGGLKFGQALTGIVLGAFSVVLFCVLASSSAGGMSAVISGGLGGGDDPSPVAPHDPQGGDDPSSDPSGGNGSNGKDPLTRQTAFANTVWTGYIDPRGGENWDSTVSMSFSASDDDGLSGDFTWLEENDDRDMAETAKGAFSVKFGADALDAAKANGFSMEPLGGEDFATYIMEEDESDLVYIELSPSSSQSEMLPGDQPTKWFGYINSGYGVAVLDIYRPSDEKIQFFNME